MKKTRGKGGTTCNNGGAVKQETGGRAKQTPLGREV